jgi:hypothetical protein
MVWVTVGIIALIVLNLMILKALLEIKIRFESGLIELDEKMAGAISSVVEKFGGGGIEPINPVQAAIANLIQMKMGETQPIKNRDESGQFKIKEILKP